MKPYDENEQAVQSTMGAFGRLFKNPAAVVFMALFLLVYSIVGAILISENSFQPLVIIEFAPLAFSAMVVGFFSILFWALNYISRERKSLLRVEEAEALFHVRAAAIDKALDGSDGADPTAVAVLKAHLLLAVAEVPSDPETPSTGVSFEYSNAVSALMRKN